MKDSSTAPESAKALPCSDFQFTVFERLKGSGAAQGTRVMCSWDGFVSTFEQEQRFPLARLTLKKGSTADYEKPDELGGWSPATFTDDYRDKANVELVSAYGADFDGTLTAAELDTRLEGLDAFRHSTFNHRVDAERHRVVIRLSRPVTLADFERLRVVVDRELFADQVDPSARDASRFWFLPGAPEDRPYTFRRFQGEALDVDLFLAASPSVPPTESGVQLVTDAAVVPSEEKRQAAALVLGQNWPAPREGRHLAQRALAGALCRDGWPEADALEFLCHVCREAGDEDRPKRTATVRDTYAAAREGRNVDGWPALEEVLEARHRGHAVKTARGMLVPFGGRDLTYEKPAQQTTPRKSAADRALTLGERYVRLVTGFPTLDRVTRGGLPVGRKVVALGGAPGAGKTTTCMQWAATWLAQGVHVGILAADEDANGLLVRLGQLSGLDRTKLEEGDRATADRLAAWCRSVPLMLWDQDEDGIALEDASKELAAAANGAPSVLVVDSIQTVRAEAAQGAKDPRTRVDAVLGALKSCSKVDRHLVIATSELARNAYKSTDQAENADPLAAFKESGGIEYGVGLALVLRSRPGMGELVDVVVPKNRFGPERPAFVLRLDFARAGVREDTIATPTVAGDKLAPFKARILALDTFLVDPKGRSVVAQRVGGKRERALAAVDALIAEGKLVDTPRGVRFRVPSDDP